MHSNSSSTGSSQLFLLSHYIPAFPWGRYSTAYPTILWITTNTVESDPKIKKKKVLIPQNFLAYFLAVSS